VLGLQGAAGTGKTTTLRVIREELEQHGYRVQGYAPTSRAAHNLSDAGIETTTLQHRLAHGPDPSPTPTVHFLDESSLASTKQINGFLTALPPQDRAVLVGDVRQHESVEAGRVFAQLQENGMHTSHISQIQRQKDPQLKQIVQLLSEGRAQEAFRGMNEQGRIKEIADPQQRYTAITNDYLADPDNSLVLTTDNRSRKEINQTIHDTLRERGHLTGPDRPVSTLATRQNFTEADKRWAGAYSVNDTIRFTTGSKKHGIAPREYVTVTAANAQDNTLTVRKSDGTSITYDPNRNHGVTVYQESQARLAAGDRIQFTQPFQEHKIANRDLGTVTSIGSDKDRSLTVKLDSGRQVTFNPRQFPHIDYGYTVTSYSSQSLTTRNVIRPRYVGQPPPHQRPHDLRHGLQSRVGRKRIHRQQTTPRTTLLAGRLEDFRAQRRQRSHSNPHDHRTTYYKRTHEYSRPRQYPTTRTDRSARAVQRPGANPTPSPCPHHGRGSHSRRPPSA
jgi:ATP-dependent exoDNAse (exonuclease V) alpha subunit